MFSFFYSCSLSLSISFYFPLLPKNARSLSARAARGPPAAAAPLAPAASNAAARRRPLSASALAAAMLISCVFFFCFLLASMAFSPMKGKYASHPNTLNTKYKIPSAKLPNATYTNVS